MWTYVAVSVGGMVGCVARYGLTQLIESQAGRTFPTATLVINIIGSFLLGFLFIEMLERITVSPAVRAGILTGGLGGFTTFSTFSVETLLLIEHGEMLKAVSYVLLSVVLGLAAALFGMFLARSL